MTSQQNKRVLEIEDIIISNEEYLEEYCDLRINKLIGNGSFGLVYTGWDFKEQSECAVKVIKRTNNYYDIEAQILQDLSHPNIIRFRRVCETKKLVYIVMEYLQGGTLKDLIDNRKANQQPFTEEESSTLMKNILNAVFYMHENSVIHRDLKPENILFGDSKDLNSLRVSDFGLSTQFKGETPFKIYSQRCGTYIYMSPEQINDSLYSKGVDIWAAGIIMYQLLTLGKHPIYKSGMSKEQYNKILKNKKQDWIQMQDIEKHILLFQKQFNAQDNNQKQENKEVQKEHQEILNNENPEKKKENLGKQSTQINLQQQNYDKNENKSNNLEKEKQQCKDNPINDDRLSSTSIEQNEKTISQIINNQIVSEQAVSLLNRLLQVEQNQRYSAHQGLRHPWVTRNLKDEVPLTVYENQIVLQNKMRLANQMKALLFIKYMQKWGSLSTQSKNNIKDQEQRLVEATQNSGYKSNTQQTEKYLQNKFDNGDVKKLNENDQNIVQVKDKLNNDQTLIPINPMSKQSNQINANYKNYVAQAKLVKQEQQYEQSIKNQEELENLASQNNSQIKVMNNTNKELQLNNDSLNQSIDISQKQIQNGRRNPSTNLSNYIDKSIDGSKYEQLQYVNQSGDLTNQIYPINLQCKGSFRQFRQQRYIPKKQKILSDSTLIKKKSLNVNKNDLIINTSQGSIKLEDNQNDDKENKKNQINANINYYRDIFQSQKENISMSMAQENNPISPKNKTIQPNEKKKVNKISTEKKFNKTQQLQFRDMNRRLISQSVPKNQMKNTIKNKHPMKNSTKQKKQEFSKNNLKKYNFSNKIISENNIMMENFLQNTQQIMQKIQKQHKNSNYKLSKEYQNQQIQNFNKLSQENINYKKIFNQNSVNYQIKQNGLSKEQTSQKAINKLYIMKQQAYANSSGNNSIDRINQSEKNSKNIAINNNNINQNNNNNNNVKTQKKQQQTHISYTYRVSGNGNNQNQCGISHFSNIEGDNNNNHLPPLPRKQQK